MQKIAVKNPDQKSLSKLVGLLGLLVGNQVPLMSHLARCVLARYILARHLSPVGVRLCQSVQVFVYAGPFRVASLVEFSHDYPFDHGECVS